jgi:hypothetical protein
MYLDDLPIWGMVGEKYQGEGKADKDTDKFIFTHRRLSVAYNGPRIIQVGSKVCCVYVNTRARCAFWRMF